jgi:WD40-like Beta Propeller Repeat
MLVGTWTSTTSSRSNNTDDGHHFKTNTEIQTCQQQSSLNKDNTTSQLRNSANPPGKGKKGRTMNPLTQFKRIPTLPPPTTPIEYRTTPTENGTRSARRGTSKRGILILTLMSLCYSGAAWGIGESKLGAWSAPINVGPPLNTQYNDTYPILAADGLTVYFTSDRPGGLGGDDLWVSRRESTDSPWGEPENLTILNSPFNDSLSVLSTSGNIMYFHSDRPGGCGAGDLWMSRAKPGGDAWTAPVNMGCVVNTSFTEIAPAFYANDDLGLSTIYFGSDRPGGIGDFDIYQTTTTDEDLESAVWGPGVLVPELSSPARDTRTFVRRDGREVFITSNRTGGVGGLDIWVATREDSSDLWSTPVNPGPPLNSAADDGSPALSRDGRTLYFFSTRPGGFGGRDIWFTVRE